MVTEALKSKATVCICLWYDETQGVGIGLHNEVHIIDSHHKIGGL